MVRTNREIQGFGPRVKQLRKGQGMSTVALAKAVGVTPATVWQWENKGRHPRTATAEAVADVLGVATRFLEGNTLLAPSIAPGQEASERVLDDQSLEALIRAIEAKGFRVRVSSRAGC